MSKTVIQMAKEAGFPFNKFGLLQSDDNCEIDADQMLERLVELARADERNSWPAEMGAMERQVNILTDALAEHAPVQERKPITDEQRQKIHNETGAGFALIRLVEIYLTEEAAHNIKENT